MNAKKVDPEDLSQRKENFRKMVTKGSNNASEGKVRLVLQSKKNSGYQAQRRELRKREKREFQPKET